MSCTAGCRYPKLRCLVESIIIVICCDRAIGFDVTVVGHRLNRHISRVVDISTDYQQMSIFLTAPRQRANPQPWEGLICKSNSPFPGQRIYSNGWGLPREGGGGCWNFDLSGALVSSDNKVDWARLSSVDFWPGFVRLTMPDLYKEASEKQGVDQGYLRFSAEVTDH